MTAEEINNIPFFFIVGKGRSGTTLLQTVLDANIGMILPLESPLIIHLKKKYFGEKKWTDKKIDNLIIDLYKDVKFYYLLGIDRKKLKDDLYTIPQKDRSFELICKLVYLHYPSIFKKEEIRIIGDKNPQYSIFVRELREVFPEAKFIHLIRDYRSNVASNKKHFRLKKVGLLTRKWEIYNRSIEKEKAKKRTAFYTLKYEDFVTEPERYTKEICEFLNIPFQLEMLQFYKNTPQYFKSIDLNPENTLHEHLIEPINSSRIESWKKDLTEKEQKIVEFISGDYAAKFGYTKLSNEKNARLYFIYLYAICRTWFDVRVLKSYYQLPFFLRDSLRFVTRKMYRLFGYVNYYSNEVFAKKYEANKTSK